MSEQGDHVQEVAIEESQDRLDTEQTEPSTSTIPDAEAEANKEEMAEIYAIIDAMSHAVQHMVIDYLNDTNERLRYYGTTNVEEILENATAYECHQASGQAVHYIEKHNKNLFTQAYLFTGHPEITTDPETNKPFTRLKDATGMDKVHSYALFQDKNNKIYAVSPANYGKVHPDFLSTIYTFETIEEACTFIRDLEGGVWDEEAVPLWLQKKKATTETSGFTVKDKREGEDLKPNDNVKPLVEEVMNFVMNNLDVEIFPNPKLTPVDTSS